MLCMKKGIGDFESHFSVKIMTAEAVCGRAINKLLLRKI